MGKGDQKSRRGKIHIGSYGRLRPVKKKTVAYTAPITAKPAEPEVQPMNETVETVKKTVKRATKKPKEETK
jgi:30S ribosomal protein S31